MIFKGYINKGVKVNMDQETKEYLERKLLGLVTKEDLEKLRQEMKSNFRQLREENKNQVLEWRQESKADFEQLGKERKVEIDPIQKEFMEGIQKLKIETQSALDQSIQKLELFLQKIKEEIETQLVYAKGETSPDRGGLKDGVESLIEGINQLTEEIAIAREKMREGFIDVKEELGSMMRFSYADLEKRFNALEARIKALEKMVFP
jgi:flagellar biosynthesis/type III secretory pathway protein FliH